MSEPALLILETSGRSGEVALGRGVDLIARRALSQSRRHARDLVPFVQQMLQEQGWRPGDLNGVIVSIGPGSYTGLRVGIMSAKVLAYAIECPIVGIQTFEVIANQAPESMQLVDVISDAQQEKVYVQTFELSAGRKAVSELRILTVQEWLSQRDSDAGVSGPGVGVYLEQIPDSVEIVEEELRKPGAETLLKLGAERLKREEHSDVWALEPIYLRPSADAEQWDRKKS